MIDGKAVAVNSDFARQAIFLSQQLDCSERYIAGLMHAVMVENPNIEPVSCMEVTISRFHVLRRHTVDCLRYLLEAAEAAEAPGASPIYARIEVFARNELIPGVTVGGGEMNLAHRMLKEVEHLGDVIAKADAGRRNAGSNTSAPSGQGESKYSSMAAFVKSGDRNPLFGL